MYDELFKNYENVVFRRKDQKPASVEVTMMLKAYHASSKTVY